MFQTNMTLFSTFRATPRKQLLSSIFKARQLPSSTATSKNSTMRQPCNKDIVLVDGVRTPFMIYATDFAVPELHVVELAKLSIMELLERTKVPISEIDYLAMGNAIQEVTTSNVGRDALLLAKLPPKIPAHTASMGCISAFHAIDYCVHYISTGRGEVCIAAGSEFMTDLPIRFQRPLRHAILKSAKRKTIMAQFDEEALLPDIPTSVEFVSKERAGSTAQRLGQMMGVSRLEQDEYTLRSHALARRAYDKGYLSDVFPVYVHSKQQLYTRDNSLRNSTLEQLTKLKPVFLPLPAGTVTAGNSTTLHDGSSASLIMTEAKAKALGLQPKAYIRNVSFACQDPISLPLLGYVFSIPSALEACGLGVKDVSVWECLEEFAAQVLANMKALDSDTFAQKYMNRSQKVGELPMDKFNAWGGSLAMGHPFGATGIRLLVQAANRLIHEDGQYACVSGCALSGQGCSIVIERHPDAPPLPVQLQDASQL